MGHGGPHYLVAAAGGLAVGQPPHGHHLLAQEGEAGTSSGQHPDPVARASPAQPLPLAAEQGNAAFIGQLAGQALEQRALARPVRAEQGSQAAPCRSRSRLSRMRRLPG